MTAAWAGSTSPATTAAAATATATANKNASAIASSSANSGGGKVALLAALTDALAGALGSVIAAVTFYPIDIAKTRVQAATRLSTAAAAAAAGPPRNGRAGSEGTTSIQVNEGAGRRTHIESGTMSTLLTLAKQRGGLARLYEGIEAKALQSLMGSFVYFYAYAFVKVRIARGS